MKSRRQAQSSALSFIDCICCGFGAVLLLFILTAKSQIVQKEAEAVQSLVAAETLRKLIQTAEQEQRILEENLAQTESQAETETTSIAELTLKQKNLLKTIEDTRAALALLDTEAEVADSTAGQERPSADRKYLSGLRLRGPRAIILLENSGSMLAEDAEGALEMLSTGTGSQSKKWLRAKAAVRAVLAAIPKGTQVAILQMNQTTTALSGTLQQPYMDPYDNKALLYTLEQLNTLEAKGSANLARALKVISGFQERPSSLLLIGDGLPTAPNPDNRSLSESDRVKLFHRAISSRPNAPFNAILLPFDGDPSAAGLFWKVSARTDGITLIPDKDWPTM